MWSYIFTTSISLLHISYHCRGSIELLWVYSVSKTFPILLLVLQLPIQVISGVGVGETILGGDQRAVGHVGSSLVDRRRFSRAFCRSCCFRRGLPRGDLGGALINVLKAEKKRKILLCVGDVLSDSNTCMCRDGYGILGRGGGEGIPAKY